MSKPTQTMTSRTDGPIHHLTVTFLNHTPHWKRLGEGRAHIEFTTHDRAGWISLDAQEWSLDGKSSKRTMLTLDEASGRRLYERLKSMYEPNKQVSGTFHHESSASGQAEQAPTFMTEDQARKEFAAYFLGLCESMAKDGGNVDKATEWDTCIAHWIEEGRIPAEATSWKCPRSLKNLL